MTCPGYLELYSSFTCQPRLQRMLNLDDLSIAKLTSSLTLSLSQSGTRTEYTRPMKIDLYSEQVATKAHRLPSSPPPRTIKKTIYQPPLSC